MSEKIFVVTSGCYSDYHIEAVFKDIEKAKVYCRCHDDCDIEDYEFSDDRCFTEFDAVRICGDIWGSTEEPTVWFYHRSEEDDAYYNKNRTLFSLYFGDFATLNIIRRLPKEYSKEEWTQKIIKIFYDIKAFIQNELLKYGDLPYTGTDAEKKKIESEINEMLSARTDI